MYDSVMLSSDALCSLEDTSCEYARRSLLRAGDVVRPLRVAAETARAVARAAGDLDDDGDRSTTSFVASTDGGSGSTADSVSELRCEGRGGVLLLRPHLRCPSARVTPSPDRLAWFSIG